MRVRMLEDRRASPNGTHVYRYRAGETYGDDLVLDEPGQPEATEYLMRSWVAEGVAVEVDYMGNPIGAPASRRATKAE